MLSDQPLSFLLFSRNKNLILYDMNGTNYTDPTKGLKIFILFIVF
jgi:hypothetical protein